MKAFLQFLKDDRGVVTVEWVAVAAAVTVGAITIAWMVLSSLEAPASAIGSTLMGVQGSSN